MLPVTCHHECPPLGNTTACASHLGCEWYEATADSHGYCAITSSQEFSGKAWIGTWRPPLPSCLLQLAVRGSLLRAALPAALTLATRLRRSGTLSDRRHNHQCWHEFHEARAQYQY